MTKTRLFVVFGVLAIALAAWAADVSGVWVADVPGREGQTRQMTFTFKADGESLTGTVGTARGETPISDGKVSGDDISFAVKMEFGGNSMTMQYKGVVSGDQIKFTSQREGADRTREFLAKRKQ